MSRGEPRTSDMILGADVIDLVGGLGVTIVEYGRGEGVPLYSEDVTPRWAPERFGDELDMLLRLAEVNEEVNMA